MKKSNSILDKTYLTKSAGSADQCSGRRAVVAESDCGDFTIAGCEKIDSLSSDATRDKMNDETESRKQDNTWRCAE